MNHTAQASRQVLRRAAIRARRLQRSLQRAMARRASPVGLSKMALVVGWLMASPVAQASPTGGVVVGGTANITSTAPGTTDIVQGSNRAIINWQSFGIGAGETVNFVQPSSSSVTLNRVLGNDPSQIFGRMNANGMVMLVNPNGIVFGKTARVDVGGLVATTANVRDHDFMVGRYDFSQASPNLNASVVNHGHISIRDSGLAALVAPRVRNAGVIEARLGRVALGAAQHFTLDFHGDGLLSFGAGSAVSDALVVNSGEIRAEGGNVLLTAQAVKGVVDNVINTSGIIAATSVSGSGGSIVLSGGSAGSVAISGVVDASSAAGQGGLVMATGEHIAVASTARVNASGLTGGGEIALGSTGLTHVAQPFADKSHSVVVDAGAQLRADALQVGSGGNITMWSTDRTVFAGSLSARGGSQGGDGGFAEVSSLKDIALTGKVDLRAARGHSGLLLIDPTDLRITDAASGGSQDGNATDTQVAAGDANQGSGATLNTLSRGLLESLSGNANILLQATGQITVDAMAGKLINLATTNGHGFTLQSTQTGGIRFVDAQTEIRTQGGAITLEALGIGSTLGNIGKLTTNGGAVSLSATGDISLAGNINAGAGAVAARSTVGSISNASGATPLLTGGAVTLTAGAGAIGAAGNVITTRTTQLGLEAGGSIHAASDTALASLALTALHVAPGTHSYQVAAPGLSFNVSDGSSLALTQIGQASGLNLRVASDRSIDLGTLDVGAGTLALTSTSGNLTGTAGTSLTASALTLAAQGSNGNNGAIGTAGQALNTSTASLSATAGSGGVYVANTGALALTRLAATGSSSATASGALTVGNVDAGSATLSLGSTGGSVLDDGDAATRITAGSLQLTAGGALGASGSKLATTAATLSANAAVGGVFVNTSATSSVLSSIVSGNGAIDIGTGGSTTLTGLTSSTSSLANSITVAASGTGSFSVGTVNAGSAGNVNLSTSSGSISGNSGLITGDTVTLNAANSGSVSVRTAASHLDVQAGSSSISITQTGSVTLDRLSTPSSSISVTSSSGDITVGNVSTSTSGQVTLTASAGAIRDDGNNATRITTGTATLNASGAIGAPGQAVQTKATGLTATSTGDLLVTNTEATLTSLNITNRHATPGVANTLHVTSPYLTFDVTDSGTQFALNRIVGVPLSTLAFSGDQTVQIGQVQGAGSVSLTATQGHLVDDGNLNTRVTAGSTLTLSAAQGSVGSLANPIGANASSLALTTRGDLYVTSLTDLSTLTLTSNHADTTTSHGMGITAPSLKLSVSDSAAGHNVATLTDNSSLSLTFTSDRDITLGQVDVTHTGTARFISTAGVIKDDGDKNTRVLANSTTLTGRAVGAAGADHMDVVTGTLAATASAGGVYVQLPMPTGSTNTTSTVTLGTITATGPVAITALEGDLSLGGFMTATNQAVTLTAMEGSILSPSGYSIAIGTGSLTLDAAKAIGASGRAIPVTSSAGATLTAQAGTSIFASSSGPMTLARLDAATSISYTQSSGAITVGHVDATAGGTVSITASNGAIQNDSDPATGIRANQVTLSAAQGSIGSGAALTVDAPKLLVTANGAVAVADSATLDTLSVTRGSGSSGSIAIMAGAGQNFTISEDSTAHYVQSVDSSTPLAFSFSGQRGVKIGHIAVGAAGSASINSAADLTNDGVPGASIAAGTVALTAGTAGSIGATGSGNAIDLEGSTALTLSAGRNVFASSDAALADLTITSTNTTTAAGTASVFGLSALGQTFGITDSGTTQSLVYAGTALANTSFTTRKNIAVGAITATGDVTLTTAGGGANSNISSASGTGTIAGNRVLLTATSSTAGGGSIGSSGTALRVDTPTVILAGSGNVYVDDAQNLTKLDMTLTHGTNTTFGYDVTAGNLSSFAVTDGNTQSLGMAVSGAMDFSYSVDRALSLATVDAGTSTTGTISLTSRSAPTGTNAQINRSSGSLTGGRITLSAVGSNGGVGAGATLSTNTKNLSIASGGNVSVSNATTLDSLSLDARHNTSGSSTHSYAVSSTGLTFSVSDTTGNTAFQLSNIAQSGLDLSVKADRVITASSVNTGAGGKVTLNSNSYVQGGSGANANSPSITTGDLTLNGGSAFGYQGSTPLYTSANTLASSLSNTLYLSNAGGLTLGINTVASSADVASSNNSLLQGSGGLFTTPTLKLSANQSLGSNDTLLTDVRRLTLVARKDIDVSNASDLYALTMTSTHGTAGVQNTVSVAAPRLALSLTDSVGGNLYHLSNLQDSTGLDFTLSTDVTLNLGTVNAQAGRTLALYSTGSTTAITNDGSSLLTAGSITLSAGGSVGAAGGSGTRMQTHALGLTLATGANAYADNAQDLSSLSLTSSQAAGGVAPVYQVTAPSLAFDITDDGTTRINNLADSTGLNFVLNTRRDQAVGVINVGRSGTVSLTSTGDILGDADSSKRISAASAAFTASNGGAIGSVGNPIRLSAPLASFAPTGALNVESDTHIDRLGISVTHPTVTYGGIYSVVSVPISGVAYPLFTATDSVTGTALTSLLDTEGLAFSFTSDRAMQVGTLNLGSTGTVALTGTGSGGILGDGDPNTLVQAASLSMVSYGGAVGATGSGNGIDATVNSVSATAQGGGVNLALRGRTLLGSISSAGGVNLDNTVGDIALGSLNAGGNAVTVNNQGGSILSGSIFNVTTVGLTAQGSIGNVSAIATNAVGGSGGTVTLSASAAAVNGALGSIALNEIYNLTATSVTAPGAVTLSSGWALNAGTITSGAAVALSSSQGSINGIDGSNAVTGTRVDLSARYGTGNGIGSSGTRLNVNTPQLVLNTPGSVYVTNAADLNLLTVDRTNYTGTGSSGTLSVIASGLSFSAIDSSNTTTLTSLSDGTGLDFTYLGIGSLSVGNLNVGAGSMLLQAYLSSGDGNINAINNGSLITAGALTLQAYGTGSNIGSSGTALGLAAGSLTASSGTGGMVLRQAGSLNLSSLSTTGDLAVTATSGDLSLGTLSYGSAKTLSLTASGGSILAGGGTLAGSGANAAIMLSAANGIGTELAPVLVNASAGHTVNASVTGTGSLNLKSLGTLNGGLTTSAHNGATTVTAAGNIKLTSMSSGTDAAGNDIRVTAGAGDITMVSVSGGAGANFNAINLAANAGRLLAAPGATLQAFDVQLHGATGVGDTTDRVAANGQRVRVSSGGGAIYLTAATPSVLTSVQSAGGAINITHSDNLLLANALSNGGAITVTGTTANADLTAGNLNAGSGALTLSTTGAGARILDDGDRNTSLAGGTVNLTGTGGVGTASLSVQTSATTLNASSGNGIYIDDNRSAGVTLASVVATGGAVSVGSAGPMLATLVQASADSVGNNVTLSTSSGDLTLVSVTAGANQGAVNLSAAGSILASGGSTHVSGHSVSLTAGADIGAVTDLTTGAGTPIRVNAAALAGLTSNGSNAVISVRNENPGAFTLQPGLLTMASTGSAYLSTAGDIGFGAGAFSASGNLLLSADGALVLPEAGITVTGRLALLGATDVRAAGATPRVVTAGGSSLYVRSGASGGATRLNTTTSAIDAALSGAGALTVHNTGTLTSATLATSNGDITATSSTGFTAGSVVAGGVGLTVTLSATNGDLSVGIVNAGSAGTINLSAANGSLLTASPAFTAAALNLTSGTGIGSAGTAFDATGMTVAAQVTGAGDIHLGSTGALTLGALSTANGDIHATAAGQLDANGALSAGQSGNVALTSTGANVTLAQAFSNLGADSARSALTVQGQQIALNGGSVATSGTQTYSGAVILGTNTTLTAGGVNFGGSVDGAQALSVNAGAGGATFTGALGATTRMGALAVNSAGATSFGSSVRAASLATDAAGSLQLNGGSVDTTGTQSYGERAVLGADTTLAGSTVTLAAGADGAHQLLITGNAVLGTLGANQALGSVTVSGSSALGGNVTTQGAQAYGGAFTLTGNSMLSASSLSFGGSVDGAHDLTVNAGAGNVAFMNEVGGSTRLGQLAINSSGESRLAAPIRAASVTTDAPGTLVLASTVNTTAAQTYGERAVLAADVTLTGSTLTLSQGADGAQALTLTGNAQLGGAIGAQQALASLSVSGSSMLNAAAITTTGMQNYGGAVTLGTDSTLTASGVNFGSSLDGAQALIVNAGAAGATFTGAVGATTRLGALAVNSPGATSFGGSVRAASLATDAAGSLQLNGGSVDTTGSQTYGERAVLGTDTALAGSTVSLADGADGAHQLLITGNALLGTLGANQALSSVTVNGSSALGGNVTTQGAQTYGAVTLTGNSVLSASGISFGGSIDGAHDLTVNAGTGDVAFMNAVGGNTRLGQLAINSSGETRLAAAIRAAAVTTDAPGTLVLAGTVDTTSAQTYGERAVLAADVALTGSSLTLSQGADGPRALTLTGNAQLGGAVGAQQALTSLTITGTGMLNAGAITTSGTQAYSGAVLLATSTTLTAGGVNFGGSVDGAQALTVNAGTASFAGAVGATIRLAALAVNSDGATTFGSSVRAASLITDAAGSLQLNGGLVETTGSQTYGERAVLGTDTTLTGSTVTLAAGADGAQQLTITGNAVLGTLGANQALGSVTVNGSSALGGNVTTQGTQTYGAVTLTGNSTLSASGLSFGGSVDGAHDLIVNAGAGNVAFTNAVGGTTRLGQLAINSSGETRLAAPIRAASVTTDAPGTLVLASTVNTTGAQTYGERAVLAADVTLTGSTLTLSQGADGAQALTLTGNAQLGGAIGAQQALASLSVSSSSMLNAAAITTTGMQNYGGAVTLGTDSTLTASGVNFGSTVDGAQALTVNSGAAGTTFSGPVGGTTRLAALAVSSLGTTSFGAAVQAASLATGVAGSLQLNGGTVDTTGVQTYGGAVVLGTDTTLTASGVSFASSVDGAQSLSVNAGAAGTTFTGAVGATARLGALTVNTPGATRFGAAVRAASLATDAAGSLQFNGGPVDTTGSQTYGERAVLGADTTLNGITVSLAAGADGAHHLVITGTAVLGALGSNQALGSVTVNGSSTLGGNVTSQGTQAYGGAVTLGGNSTLSASGLSFGGSVDGARDLTINAATGNVAFTHAVGGSTRLGQLAITSSGETRLAAPVRAASLTTDAAGTLVLASTVDTTGAQSYGERAVLAASTALTGSTLTLSQGADGAQALTLTGDAQIGGAIGAQQALSSLSVSGSSALNAGSVTTTGDQTYSGAVTLQGDHVLDAGAGRVAFGSTVDGAHALTLRSGAGGVRVDHAVGGQTRLGAVAIHTSGETRLAAPIRAASLTTDAAGTLVLASTVDTTGAQSYGEHAVLAADVALTGSNVTLAGGIDATTAGGQGATITGSTTLGGAVGAGQALNMFRINGPLTALGAQGLQLTGHSFAFSDAVTATLGGITLTNTHPSGTTTFAVNGAVQAATGFAQTGGASVLLPATITVTAGPISIDAPAVLPDGMASISTEGDITLRGLSGPSTALMLTAGGGALSFGLADADPASKVSLGSLAVRTAASAQMFGSLGSSTGPLVASRVNSTLAGAPYFFNGTPWGPIEAIAIVTSSTVPRSVVPSTPGASALFTHTFTSAGLAPSGLAAFAAPQVLTVSPQLLANQPRTAIERERERE